MNDQISNEEKDELSDLKEILKDRPLFISHIINDAIMEADKKRKESEIENK